MLDVKNMLNYLVQSIKTINSNLIFVIILALTNIYVFSGAMIYVAVLSAVFHFIVAVIAYGRIVSILTHQRPVDSVTMLKINWLNYLIVTVVLGLPVFVLASLPLGGLNVWIAKIGIGALIGGMSIYVYPILFLKCEGIVSIIAGIYFVVKNLKFSSPLIVATIVSSLVSNLLKFELLRHFSNLSSLLLVMALMSFMVVYIDLTIFGTASLVLISETDLNYTDQCATAQNS